MAAEGGLPRRVLMTADAMGGVWTYTKDLTSWLHQNGVQVLVAVMGDPPKDSLDVPVVHNPVRLEWQDRADPESTASGLLWLRRLADNFQPDLIHLNSYAHASAVWSCPVVVVAHSCVFSWWRAVHGCTPPAEWDGYRARVQQALADADAVVAPSRAMLDNLAVDYGFAAERGTVIYNFRLQPPVAFAKKENRIVSAGRRWDEAKNLAMLESITGELRWLLTVAGGEYGREAMDTLLDRARIFAHPALYEPFGLGVLEAAQRGCALVLADIPSLRELWSDAAVFAHPAEPEAWAAALNQLAEDESLRSRFAALASERSHRFSMPEGGTRYLNLYRAVIHRWEASAVCV